VLSSHLLEEVERVSDAVVILDAGRVVASGRISELRGADSGEVVIHIEGPADALVLALHEAGIAAVAEGERAIVAVEGPAVYDAIRDVLADMGVGLRRMEARTSSLEDVFLAAGSDA
jgi:ABC-type uncharacterized transport system ATPase subunit